VILSDHGFTWGADRPKVASGAHTPTAVYWHRPDALLIVAGPGVVADRARRRLEPLDVLPGLLALAGLPPGDDLPGRAPTWLVRAPTADLPAVRWASLAPVTRAQTVELPPEAKEEELAKLRALGYLGGAEPDRAPAGAGGSTRTGGSFNNEGLILKSLGRRAEAAATFERALALDPNLASALWNLSELRFEGGDLDRADELLVRALEARLPEGERNTIERALTYARQGEGARSLALLDRAVAALPEAPRLLVFRGRYRIERRDCAGALADFEAAATLDPADPTAPASAGIALLCLGRPAEAAASLRRSLELDPDQPPVREFLARLQSGASR